MLEHKYCETLKVDLIIKTAITDYWTRSVYGMDILAKGTIHIQGETEHDFIMLLRTACK